MSWNEVLEARRAWRAERSRAPIDVRETDYSPEEVMKEVQRVISDVRRFLAERPESGEKAFVVAKLAASLRDRHRPAASRDALGSLATLFASWVIKRADREPYSGAVEAALLAARGDAHESELAAELTEFVRGYLAGAISGEEFDRRINHPLGRRGRARASRTTPAGAVRTSAAAATLEKMLADADVEHGHLARCGVWQVFRTFAEFPMTPERHAEHLDDRDGDLLLFEWGMFENDGNEEFLLDLVRQFSFVDADGTYAGMEQTHCSMWLTPTPELRRLRSGSVWSDGDVGRWIAEVSRAPAFPYLDSSDPVRRIDLRHERV
jgi:hypothetical protein